MPLKMFGSMDEFYRELNALHHIDLWYPLGYTFLFSVLHSTAFQSLIPWRKVKP